LSILGGLIGGCATSDGVAIQAYPDPSDDSGYVDQFDADTRYGKIYNNFETVFIIHTTYLSPKFREAFVGRLQGLMNQEGIGFELEEGQVAFFVSVFAPDVRLQEIDDHKLWTLQLGLEDKKFSPKRVLYLSKKPRWEPFFPYIHQWSREYLVVFETADQPITRAKMGTPTNVGLTMTSLEGRIDLAW
jgi:hypothetical protein